MHIEDELKYHLWGYVAKHSEHDDAIVDFNIDIRELAEGILRRIEDCGMSPPKNPKFDPRNRANKEPIFGWEPEGE